MSVRHLALLLWTERCNIAEIALATGMAAAEVERVLREAFVRLVRRAA